MFSICWNPAAFDQGSDLEGCPCIAATHGKMAAVTKGELRYTQLSCLCVEHDAGEEEKKSRKEIEKRKKETWVIRLRQYRCWKDIGPSEGIMKLMI